MTQARRPLMLMMLDGWGYREAEEGNAIKAARTPNLDLLLKEYPWCFLEASGEAVGLPEGQMGNSEVGHLNIGAGQSCVSGSDQNKCLHQERRFFRKSGLSECNFECQGQGFKPSPHGPCLLRRRSQLYDSPLCPSQTCTGKRAKKSIYTCFSGRERCAPKSRSWRYKGARCVL